VKTPAKLAIVAGLALAVAAAIALKPGKPKSDGAVATPTQEAVNAKLPRLVDLGADKCIPCKMMAPILAELKAEYEGRLIVEFVDVWKNKEAGEQYGIQMIPTQIFLDAEGRELFRHTGFLGKEDILAKWKELGVSFEATK